ncbi:hypothetical protein DFH07DRAFT_840530 [Mycena maculata]|uniref:Uncharacterized protein n=1 Tax=Mycena maculata TaxID=230809 RepID=A0AAD7MZI1_9AGAR|nr:hypothetical protein DFH07DRAFT_840530 [Mycena maculata]
MADALLNITTDTLGVQEEVISLTSLASGTDIHDVNRKKIEIVIRPRCKEYAQKQRTIRTLACLNASKSKTVESQDVEDRPITPVKPPTTEACETKFTKKICVAPSIRSAKKTPTKPRAMLVGRIQKLSRSPPPSPPRKVHIPDLPVNAPAAVELALEYELYSCGCSTPSDCRQCTLRRLADKFCAIVAARKEKIRQNEGMAIYS